MNGLFSAKSISLQASKRKVSSFGRLAVRSGTFMGRFEKLRTVFKSNGSQLKDFGGKTRTINQFKTMCFELGIATSITTLNEDFQECVKELAVYSKDEVSPIEFVADHLDPELIFDDFELIEDGKGSPILKYTNPKTNQKFILGTVADVDHRLIYKSLISFGRPTLNSWLAILMPYVKYLKIDRLTEEIAVDTIWNLIYSGLAQVGTRYIDPEAMPVALQGLGKPADYIIPYFRKESTLGDLHPFLRGFLERTQDHKYFCAILASRLLGFKQPYIPYLVGAGGDGKSTFMTFLDKLVNGYTANLDLSDSTYGLYGCIDKIFLFINDTSNKRVFYYETVKNISGNDYTRVNGKYQHAKDVKLPGLIIISSNQLPVLNKAEWLKRRARIFQVAKMSDEQKENLVDVPTAAALMTTTANEFLNYCLQCLREVGNSETGVVRNPPAHVNIMDTADSSEEDEYEDFILDLGFQIGVDCTVTEYSFRKKIRMKCNDQRKNEYFMENFLAYLREKKGITRTGGYYHGIGMAKNETSTTKFVGKSA